MRLLICTQAVDRDDPALGFFLAWIERLARECEHVLVVCLRKGIHTLPKNVEVISLGERHRFLRGLEVCAIALGRHAEYDAVFVHMNPEYIVAAGWLWRLMQKKVVLWYTHKSVNLRLRIATFFANTVLTASKESFRLPSRKVAVVGHGIDTAFFAPVSPEMRGEWVLSVGRLMQSKRHDLAITGAAQAGRRIRIIGEGPERPALEKLAQSQKAEVEFLGGCTQAQVRDEYGVAAFLVHTSETGSLDKVVLEALATNLPVITTSDAYGGFPVEKVSATPEAIAEALRTAPEPRDRASSVRANHSLEKLIPTIMHSLKSK